MELEEMEKRLRTLEDIEAIKTLHHNYAFWLTSSQWDEISDCFAEDAEVNIWKHGPRKGKKEILKFFREVITAGRKSGSPGHLVAQPVINVDGDRAKGYWIMYLFFNEPTQCIQGRHDCEYVRVEGKWKIKSVKFTRPWPVQPDTFPK
jgi:hypothetical protein